MPPPRRAALPPDRVAQDFLQAVIEASGGAFGNGAAGNAHAAAGSQEQLFRRPNAQKGTILNVPGKLVLSRKAAARLPLLDDPSLGNDMPLLSLFDAECDDEDL